MPGRPGQEVTPAPLASELNRAKRLLSSKGFDAGSAVTLWGPGLDRQLMGIAHSGVRLTLTLRAPHPWMGLPELPADRLAATLRPLLSELRRLGAAVAGVEARPVFGDLTQLEVSWGDYDFPPVVSLGIQMLAFALAAGRAADPDRSVAPPPSLAEVFSRGRRRP